MSATTASPEGAPTTAEYAVRYTDRIYGSVQTIRRGIKPGDLDWAIKAARRVRGEWADYEIACHIVTREDAGTEWKPLETAPQLADTKLGHPGTIAPYACRWCRTEKHLHVSLWADVSEGDRFIGWHSWEAPSQPLIKLRMRARRVRAARLAGLLPALKG